MKIKLALLTAIIATFPITILAQVKVIPNKVSYERKGSDIPEWKKTVEVSYPKFAGVENPEVLKRLERTFDVWSIYQTTLEEELDYQWLESINFKVNYNKHGILELEFMRYGSGAYPSEYKTTVVAEISSGSRLEMTEVFKNRIQLLTEIDKLQQAEIARAKEQNREYSETDGSEFNDVSKASDQVKDFSVGDLGVTFLFDYGFPHVIKALQPEGKYFFSWSQLKPYLREYSTLTEAAQNAPNSTNTVVILDLKIGGILGGVSGGYFVDARTAAKLMAPDSKFVVLEPSTSNSKAAIKNMPALLTAKIGAEQSDDICPEFRYVETLPESKKGIAIAGNAGWSAIPRNVSEINRQSGIYEAVVLDFLRSKGLTNPAIKIEQLYKVDLEGDGVDEVVIGATNYTHSENEFAADKGGYSLVMVRKIVDGKVKDILLGGDFITRDDMSAESTYEIAAIADLNGDGNMEIVVFGSYYEGASSFAFQIVGGEATAVLETGCGL